MVVINLLCLMDKGNYSPTVKVVKNIITMIYPEKLKKLRLDTIREMHNCVG